MVRWVVGSILHGVDPLSYFSFQPVFHDWCNKGRGICYPLWDGAYKRCSFRASGPWTVFDVISLGLVFFCINLVITLL